MALDTRIVDGGGSGQVCRVHNLVGLKSDQAGQLVLQERFLNFNPEVHPFLNDNFGTGMNQNISFGGTPEIIHNGGTSTEWTGTALSGTWNFADAGTVSLTNGVNGNAARFSEPTGYPIDTDDYTAITGKINLTTYNEAQNSIMLIFDTGGTPTGSSIDLNDYIDSGLIGTEQNFVIPKVDLGLTGQTVDGFTVTLSRAGGPTPTFAMDDIQIEQTGNPAVFKATTPVGTRFHIDRIRISIADNVSSIVTGSSTTYPTMHGLSYDSILGVSALANGITFQRVQKGVVQFAVTLKQISDFLASGSQIVNAISDGTNTHIVLEVRFFHNIIIEGGLDSFLSFTINDDLSGLLEFTASTLGAIEI